MPKANSGLIDLSHGSGGLASARLIEQIFQKYFDNELLRAGNDAASFNPPAGRMVMSTDGHVVTPLFFPGGDIGCLSVHGTINDLAMMGARPLYLSAGFILEEGLPISELERIVASMAKASKEAGVPVVTGDTKVVERGKADGLFITTTGIGIVPEGVDIGGDKARPGDQILVSGCIGEHGATIMASRAHLGFSGDMQSDTAALHTLVAEMLAYSRNIHCLRDPTRGGLATTLNELASQSGVSMLLEESAIPIREPVSGACELLGLDPLYLANEGKLICICPPEVADGLLAVMRNHPLGRDAALIGTVQAEPQRMVAMRTQFGGTRVIDWLAGEQLPRIC